MGKFSGVLLATDYDDTLYDSKGTISPENRAAIDRFLAEGGLFSISTGRSYINFVIQMEREKLPVNAPVILSNGASIYDFAKEESLWLKFLPKRAPVHIAKLCAAFPELGFEAYHQDEVYAFRPNVITYRHLTRCRLRGRRRDIEDMPTPWLKVILQHPDTAVLQQAQEYLLSRWSDIYEATFSNRNLLEVTAKGANKGFSVLWLAQHLGVEQKDSVLHWKRSQRHSHALRLGPVLRPRQQLPGGAGGRRSGLALLRRELCGPDDRGFGRAIQRQISPLGLLRKLSARLGA